MAKMRKTRWRKNNGSNDMVHAVRASGAVNGGVSVASSEDRLVADLAPSS